LDLFIDIKNEAGITVKQLKSAEKLGTDLVYVTTEDLKDCGNACILEIVVKRDDSFNLENENNFSYLLTLTRGITQLTEGVVQTTSIIQGSYMYFKFLKTCKSCDLVISFNPIGGESATVVVNYNNTQSLPS
jgi:hypothetical protein